jgi:hypothetical protein
LCDIVHLHRSDAANGCSFHPTEKWLAISTGERKMPDEDEDEDDEQDVVAKTMKTDRISSTTSTGIDKRLSVWKLQ